MFNFTTVVFDGTSPRLYSAVSTQNPVVTGKPHYQLLLLIRSTEHYKFFYVRKNPQEFILKILANTEQNLIASPKGHPAFAHPWYAKCVKDGWGTIRNKGFALTSRIYWRQFCVLLQVRI